MQHAFLADLEIPSGLPTWLACAVCVLAMVRLVMGTIKEFKGEPIKPSYETQLSELRAAHTALEATIRSFVDAVNTRLDNGANIHRELQETQSQLKTAQAINSERIAATKDMVTEIKDGQVRHEHTVERLLNGLRTYVADTVREVYTHPPKPLKT
jgi:paraquat-inducible protein B